MDLLALEKEYLVHVYETGPDGKLSLYSMFDFFQDIASDHAVKLGYGRDDLLRHNNFWVLSRIYAEIDQWPEWGNTITLKTWPRGTEKLFALRDFEVRFPDGKILARATSSWLIIDMTSRRIQLPDDTLSSYRSLITRAGALPRNAMKIEPASPDGYSARELNVRISDLDVNLHTNNVGYLKWVTDSYDLDFVMNNIPYSAEINYLAESRFNDKIRIRISEEKGTEKIFNHSILRISDETELCRIRIKWKNNHIQQS
jgi:acyl-ACP thioesterase